MQQGAWVRLFVNNEPIGLHLMVDDISKSFLKQTVHEGNDNMERGSLIQMNAWNENKATLEYKGPTSDSYDQQVAYTTKNLGNNPETDPLKELIAFMKDLQDFDATSTTDPVQYFNATRLDLDGFLRNLALEYSGGAFDNYWVSASNYFMYKNPTLGPTVGNGNGYPQTLTVPLAIMLLLRLCPHTRPTTISSRMAIALPFASSLFRTKRSMLSLNKSSRN